MLSGMNCIEAIGMGETVSAHIATPEQADLKMISYSLISASVFAPGSVIERLCPYLAGSASIVIYSPYQHVLAQTLKTMKEKPEFLAPNLTESWMRKYQVFPGRTHPEMQTSGTGGYLLHATYVCVLRPHPDQHDVLMRPCANSFPNHEAGWLTAASVRKRNRQNEREKSKKAKLAQEGDQAGAGTSAVSDSKTAEAAPPSAPNSLITGYVRVPQVSLDIAGPFCNDWLNI